MTIGFDYDGVLTNKNFTKFIETVSTSIKKLNKIVITNRSDIEQEIIDHLVNIGLDNTTVYAIGNGEYNNKAQFVADEELKIDIFFDDNMYEVHAMSKLGITCLWIPPYEDTVMTDLYKAFIEDEYNALFG